MVELTIQVADLPAAVLGVAIADKATDHLTVLLQQGLSRQTTANVIAEALDRPEEDPGVRT